ncbi:nitroreductase [Neisseria weixii]|uniref:Nitroreductase n=1 Tax=Neisseria weixii TaxID=1853276 RepID=A0A3N4N162_9NEIS|nr:nitroreductase [Neisseria weixii]RPD89801.1 nitroreductase [Neisseria weixii]RPD90029.1 nitroreductase [Neisseria weixii]
MLDFETTVKTRQSIRKFLPAEMTEAEIKQILTDAQNAPSACNTQPWLVHIASGETLQRLHKIIGERFREGKFSPDFEFDQSKFTGIYEPRWRNQYAHVFTTSFGVPREDKAGRRAVIEQNITGYGAAHMAFLFMPGVDNHDVNIAADMGMYSQTFLLSLTARGFGGIPMLFLGLFADDIRRELGVSGDYKLLHGIAFGHPDWDARQNKTHLGRVPVEESAVLHW